MRKSNEARRRKGRPGHVDELLDDALRMTFPASDPIAPAIDTAPAEAPTRHDDLQTSRPDSIRSTEH
jgi:hypothetical protein